LKVNFEDTFLSILQTALNKSNHNRSFDVINAGVPGYGPDQAFTLLKEIENRIQHEMVMLGVYLGNDLSDMVEPDYTVQNGLLVRNKVNRLKSLFRQFRVYQKAGQGYYRLRKLTGVANHNTRPEPERYDFRVPAELLKSTLANISLHLKTRGIPLIVIIIPTEDQVHGTRQNRLSKKVVEWKHEWEHDPIYAREMLLAYCQTAGIACIDLLPDLSRAGFERRLYFDCGPGSHWNQEGHRLVAEVIAKWLRSNYRFQ
jgi:hypothetical protein